MDRSTNKRRHRWIDRGNSEGVELYDYDCLKCGARKIRRSAYSAEYHKDGVISTRAPKCQTRDEAVAEQIVTRLFTNGAGQDAKRLVLELEDGRDGGGWGREPVRDVIVNVLKGNGEE